MPFTWERFQMIFGNATANDVEIVPEAWLEGGFGGLRSRGEGDAVGVWGGWRVACL